MMLRTTISWLWPILYVLGLIIAIQGWRNSKKTAYVLFIIYFALAFYSVTAAPHVNGWIKHRSELKRDPAVVEAQTKMEREILKLHEKYNLPYATKRSLPLGQVLLVLGLWMIVRKEKNTEPGH